MVNTYPILSQVKNCVKELIIDLPSQYEGFLDETNTARQPAHLVFRF